MISVIKTNGITKLKTQYGIIYIGKAKNLKKYLEKVNTNVKSR